MKTVKMRKIFQLLFFLCLALITTASVSLFKNLEAAIEGTFAVDALNSQIKINFDRFGKTEDGQISISEALNFNFEKRSNLEIPVLEGSELFPVGVIDSGLEYTHDDLKDFLYKFNDTPPIEVFGGLRIEGDYYGYDFSNRDLLPYDDHYVDEIEDYEELDSLNFWNPLMRNGLRYLNKILRQGAPGHGTHVSGIVIEMCDERCSILPMKVFGWQKASAIDRIIQAVDYAQQRGIRVVNMSLCITESSTRTLREENPELLAEKIETLKAKMSSAKETLFVVAAGNNSTHLSESSGFFYPAQFDIENMIVVGAVDEDGVLASFSNYDLVSVDVYAPGVKINSTYPFNTYMEASGTSMAAPYIAGLVSKFWQDNPSLTVTELKNEFLSRVPERQLVNLEGDILEGFEIPILLRGDL